MGSVDKGIIQENEIARREPASKWPIQAEELQLAADDTVWLLSISKKEIQQRKLSYVVVNGALWLGTVGATVGAIVWSLKG